MQKAGKQDRSDEEAIAATASAWVVRRHEGLTAREAAAFASWRQADPRHAAAVARLDAAWALLEDLRRVPAEAFEREGPIVPARSRRRRPGLVPMLGVITAIAAALAAAAILWVRTEYGIFGRNYATAEGGYYRATLPDGSVMTLNAGSDLRVEYSLALRRVIFARGEANFDVAKNKARPFVVDAGGISVRAVGTAFDVRMDSSKVVVLVTEGRVQVGPQRAPAPLPPGAADRPDRAKPESEPNVFLVAEGQRGVVTISDRAAPVVEKMGPSAIREALGWQEQRLFFSGTPLAEVVRQFNRHNRVQLLVGDPELAARPVGGSFRADNVETFVRLLEDSHDVAVERPSPDRIILRKAP